MVGTTPFTTERTHAVLVEAGRISGLTTAGATLVRFGENAMYRLSNAPLIVRIGRSVVAATKEAHVAGWLEKYDFPAARLASGFEEPLIVDGLPVTFWDYIEENGEPITSADFGAVLHDLHALPHPTDFELPKFSPMPKIEQRLDRLPAGYLSEEDVEFVRRRHHEVAKDFAQLNFVLPPGPVHGDAHPGNLMRSSEGVIKLIDFEDFAYGPREWDAAVLSVRHQAFGWASEREYRSYVDAYGFDPITWDGFPVVRAARELNMTTWLAQSIDESEDVLVEVRKRIADLRDDQAPREWRVF